MLDIDMEFKKGILIARLRGVLDKNTIEIYKNDLDKTIEDNGIKYIMLNLKKLFLIDNEGLEAIKESYQKIINNKGKLIICGIEKLLDRNYEISESLYQVGEEVKAYDIVSI